MDYYTINNISADEKYRFYAAINFIKKNRKFISVNCPLFIAVDNIGTSNLLHSAIIYASQQDRIKVFVKWTGGSLTNRFCVNKAQSTKGFLVAVGNSQFMRSVANEGFCVNMPVISSFDNSLIQIFPNRTFSHGFSLLIASYFITAAI